MEDIESIRKDIETNIGLYVSPKTFTSFHASMWLQEVMVNDCVEFQNLARLLAARALIAFERGETSAHELDRNGMAAFYATLSKRARTRIREILGG